MTTLIVTEFGAMNKGLTDLIQRVTKAASSGSEYEHATLRAFWTRRFLLGNARVNAQLEFETSMTHDELPWGARRRSPLGGCLEGHEQVQIAARRFPRRPLRP